MKRFTLGTLLLLTLCPRPGLAQTWEEISHEEGIQVWQREIPDTSLVEFRGRGIIEGPFQKILAILYDQKKKTEWMESCVRNRRVRAISAGHAIIYNRTGSSFPFVSDRDVVLESTVELWPEKKQIRVDFWNVEDPDAPPVDGAVRMPKLLGSWVLEVQSPERTRLTYQIQADPGGALPHWVVNLVAKKMPFRTLANLRKQMKKPGYDEDLAHVQSSFDWDTFLGIARTGDGVSHSLASP